MHTFSTRVLNTLIAGLVTVSVAVGLATGYALHPATQVRTQDAVTSYNDGWTDAMASQGLDANGHHLGR